MTKSNDFIVQNIISKYQKRFQAINNAFKAIVIQTICLKVLRLRFISWIMIYDQHGPKFRYYLRQLTQAEHVARVYHREMDSLRTIRDKDTAKELSRHFSDWDDAAPALFVDMIDMRKKIEFAKWQKKHARQDWVRKVTKNVLTCTTLYYVVVCFIN